MLPTLFALWPGNLKNNVLAGKASCPYDDGRVQVGDKLPRPCTLDKYWGNFLSMQGNASTRRFSDNQGRHLDCRVVGICDNTFIIARLSKALSCAAEMKRIHKADLDMDFNVPKFNVFFPDVSFSLDTARSALERAVREDDLAAMGPGVSTDGKRVAGVPVCVDA